MAIANFSAALRPTVIGRGWAPAAGVERGDIVDLNGAGRALAAALEAAERAAGCRVGQAIVATGGRELTATLRRGQLTLGRDPVTVTRKHATRAVNSIVQGGPEPGQEILHVIPRSFWLDGAHLVRNPLGMPAARLEVEAHVVAASSAAIRNVIRCVQDQGLEVRELVAAPLATAEASLTAQEREAGVLLVDLGMGSTGAVAFTQGTPAATALIPVGGQQITGDIAIVLRVSLRQAEQLKLSYGRAQAGNLPDQLVDVPDDEAIGLEPVSQRLLCDVIEARLEETFEQVMQAVAATGFAEPLPAGVVLAGGGASLPDVAAVARRLFGLPARAATVSVLGAPVAALAPSWGTAAGLLSWVQRGRPDLLPEGAARTTRANVGRLARLLRPLGGG